MKTAEEKTQMLRAQVNAKVIWGARDREILDWLQEQHGIIGDGADEILAEAYRAKRAAVRYRAFWQLGASVVGMLAAGGFIFLQVTGRFIVVGYGSVLIVVFGVVSVGLFLRSLFRLLTGQNQGSVD